MNYKKGKIVKCLFCGVDKYFRLSHFLMYKNHFCSKKCSQMYKTEKNHPKYKHGLRNTRFYRIWVNMRSRCKYDNRDNSKWYKEKGIKVCKKWEDFEKFRDDMYIDYLKHTKLFGVKDTTIDRINSSKDYTLSNCKWATWKEQQSNPRTTNRNIKS